MLRKSKTYWNIKKNRKKNDEKHEKYYNNENIAITQKIWKIPIIPKIIGRKVRMGENPSLPEPEHTQNPYNVAADRLLLPLFS